MANAMRLDKANDRFLNPLASYGAQVNKLNIYGGSMADKEMTLGMFHAPEIYNECVPLNYIGKKFIRAPLLGGLEYKPMSPNTSSQKIPDNQILHTSTVKKHFY